MVALGTRVRKLEKKIADRSQTGPLGDKVVYQPSEEELGKAMESLIACGAMRQVRS